MYFKTLAIFLALCCTIARANFPTTVAINPSDDGSIYTCDACNHSPVNAYVTTSGYIQGVIRFPTAPIVGPVTNAFITVNPYGLGLGDLNVSVYGIAAGGSSITFGDGNAGTFLGTMHLPPNLNIGEDASFDVTSFLSGVSSPYIAFNLRTVGLDIFSSLQNNVGHTSQLHVTFVPELSTCTILWSGLFSLLPVRRSRSSCVFRHLMTS